MIIMKEEIIGLIHNEAFENSLEVSKISINELDRRYIVDIIVTRNLAEDFHYADEFNQSITNTLNEHFNNKIVELTKDKSTWKVVHDDWEVYTKYTSEVTFEIYDVKDSVIKNETVQSAYINLHISDNIYRTFVEDIF